MKTLKGDGWEVSYVACGFSDQCGYYDFWCNFEDSEGDQLLYESTVETTADPGQSKADMLRALKLLAKAAIEAAEKLEGEQ